MIARGRQPDSANGDKKCHDSYYGAPVPR